ncbi:MAG: AMP-binding protein, partial [Flavobacteriales bacterium]|nr:AMP-binding protein [Flavobacteriales bacterium]
MAARSPYPAIARAFDRITVDGKEMSAMDLYLRADRMKDKARTEWTGHLLDVLSPLALGRGGLRVRTSGTTGPPKRFTIPRADLVHSARLTGATFGLLPGDRVLHCLPTAFIAGQMMLVRGFALGLDMHFIDPQGGVLNKLKVRDRFKFTAMVPLQLHRAVQEDRARVEAQFDTILLGGGPVSQALIEDLAGLGVQVFQGYGSTETVTHVALRRLNGPGGGDGPFTAIGRCHFGRDPRGCLVVYTPHLGTKQHLTNDLVDLLDDTTFRWKGRFDNVILSGGKKIFPEQLEARTAGVLHYPHYFTGVSDPVLGQSVMLVLETDRPQDEVLPEVLEQVMAVLHPHEWPR